MKPTKSQLENRRSIVVQNGYERIAHAMLSSPQKARESRKERERVLEDMLLLSGIDIDDKIQRDAIVITLMLLIGLYEEDELAPIQTFLAVILEMAMDREPLDSLFDDLPRPEEG